MPNTPLGVVFSSAARFRYARQDESEKYSILRQALRPVILRIAPIKAPRKLSFGKLFSLRKLVKFLVWIFRYSIGIPAKRVARRIEQSNVEPVRCTEAIANRQVVGVVDV